MRLHRRDNSERSNGTNTLFATSPNAPEVQPYKQLFLRSNLGGGSSESLGVNGETDIIRRTLVGNTPISSLVHDIHSNNFDCVTINGHPEINQLWFQLIDVDGKVVDTHVTLAKPTECLGEYFRSHLK